jgi:GPH family glycoside/pentoside/hexuronide:cation symporter
VLFGYVSGEEPGPRSAEAFRFLISAVPLVFLTLALLISRWLPFGGQQTESET